MKILIPISVIYCTLCGPVQAADEFSSNSSTSVHDGWVTVSPPEFEGAINNPLKGFREYKKDGYGLLERQYIKWSDIEVSADDSVERIMPTPTRSPTPAANASRN